jgi:hypothetical protein
MDQRLSAIFREDEFGIMSTHDLNVVEVSGSTAQRLRAIQNAMCLPRSN